MRIKIVFLLALFLFLLPSWVHAVGVTPGEIMVENMKSGTKVLRSVYFSRSNPKKDQTASVVINGDAAKFIVPADGKDTFVMKKGVSNAEYLFWIQPTGLTPGLYSADLTIVPVQDKNDVEQSNVITGAQAKISFTITDEDVIDYKISDLSLQKRNTEYALYYRFINNGNVSIDIDSIVLGLRLRSKEHINEYTLDSTYRTTFQPHSEMYLSEPLLFDIAKGSYDAEVSFLINSSAVFSEPSLSLVLDTDYSGSTIPPDTLDFDAQGEIAEQIDNDKNVSSTAPQPVTRENNQLFFIFFGMMIVGGILLGAFITRKYYT